MAPEFGSESGGPPSAIGDEEGHYFSQYIVEIVTKYRRFARPTFWALIAVMDASMWVILPQTRMPCCQNGPERAIISREYGSARRRAESRRNVHGLLKITWQQWARRCASYTSLCAHNRGWGPTIVTISRGA